MARSPRTRPSPPRRARPAPPRRDAVADEHRLDEDWRARDIGADRFAREAEADRLRFLATATHEIRTPLAAILGQADLLLSEPLTPAQTAYARAIRASGEALMSLIEDVLDISRIGAGRLDLKPEPTALQPLLEGLIELVAPRAHAKGLELALRLGDPLPEVDVDGGRLRQVLLNLVGNAIKFTDTGGVELAVARDPASSTPTRVALRFTVSDTGPGIAEADHERIFGEYEQAESGLARRGGGTGLGLPIAAAIVAAMGGRIGLSSRPGGGACFSFTLDFSAPAPTATGVPPPNAGIRLLVLSPGRFEGPALAAALARSGIEADLVEGLWDARRALAGRRFDGLLIEHGDDDAGRLLGELGEDLPPAFVLIRPLDRHELSRLRAVGFVGHLVRPVRAASLHRAVGTLARGGAMAEPMAPRIRERLDADVLLAEDDDINALLARTLLTRLGARVDLVGDGEAAVSAVRARLASGRPYDLVLLDMHMPGLDGADAIAELRRVDPEGHARILALTADPTEATRAAAMAAGADGRLLKPLTGAALLAAMT